MAKQKQAATTDAKGVTDSDVPLMAWEAGGNDRRDSLANATAQLADSISDEALADWETPDELMSDAEDTPPGSEAEPDAERDDDLDDDAEDEGEAEPLYKVKGLDGEDVEVTIDELRDGWMRTQDYTRKTQAVAADRRAAQQEKESARLAVEAIAQRTEMLMRFANNIGLSPQQMQALEADYVAVRRAQEQDMLSSYEARLVEEKELLQSAIPEWKDPEVAKAEKAALREFVNSSGYSDEELASVTDHRLMLIVRKAMKYDKLMADAGEPVQRKLNRAPVLRPGGKAGGTPASGRSKALRQARAAADARLRETGSARDAVDAIALMLSDDD